MARKITTRLIERGDEMATGKSLLAEMEEADGAGDALANGPMRRKVPVLVTAAERCEIDKAVVLWQALHGDPGEITYERRGETIAAILGSWRRDEAERLRGA
jgi:hypothetical protein